MKVFPLTVGQMGTNCYLVSDEITSHTLIIDPGDESDFIGTTILENKLIPTAIILTHGHYDHCLGVLELKLNFSIPIYLHQADHFLYQNIYRSNSIWASPVKGRGTAQRWRGLKPPPVDFFLSDQQIIPFGESRLQVLHTPGHTPGSCCFLAPRSSKSEVGSLLFTGDTLFANGVGRTDLPYSSTPNLQSSLSRLRSTIHDRHSTILIYPGHEDFEIPISSTMLY